MVVEFHSLLVSDRLHIKFKLRHLRIVLGIIVHSHALTCLGLELHHSLGQTKLLRHGWHFSGHVLVRLRELLYFFCKAKFSVSLLEVELLIVFVNLKVHGFDLGKQIR